MLLVVGDREPVLDQSDARADKHPFEFRNATEKLLDSSSEQKPITRSTPDRLYQERSNRTIRRAPAGVARSAENTTAFRVRSARKRHDAAHTRINRCVMRLMTPPLPAASRPSKITTASWRDPILQLYQFALKSEQLFEIDAAVERLAGRGRIKPVDAHGLRPFDARPDRG